MSSDEKPPPADDLCTLRSVEDWELAEGSPAPLGATWVPSHQAYNFSLYSRYALGVTLRCYRQDDPVKSVYEYRLNPRFNKTGRIWHCWVPVGQLRGATLYAYRVEGPTGPVGGHRFDPEKVLLDPYARAVYFPPNLDRQAAIHPGANDGRAPLGVLPPQAEDRFDWGDTPAPRHTGQAIVYELHVKGFTARANSGVAPAKRGTFAGLIEKIPYLKELGVTVVELLPVHQFDPQEHNYWGYMTLNFFAPHRPYAGGDPIEEFRELVKAFHAAGIEVWLDVVYNHTCEGDDHGPTYSYRGIDNHSYYLLGQGLGRYLNDSGCGNMLRAAHPSVRMLVLGSLRYWAREMGVDGFRFDLASILTRNHDGSINLSEPALLTEITTIAHYTDVSLTAEAWDPASYQLGRAFPALTWRQWNGKFRDDIRAFVRGDSGKVGALMVRLYGSDDLFPDSTFDTCRPSQSVNYITSHDGFCLYDLVSYNHKHNEANGHNNTDGPDNDLSWNCGWEGDDDVPLPVLELRRRQVKNFFCLLLLANGTPMFCAGDEFLNTQRGNNNPYNQDNETTWLDWDLLDRNLDLFRFVRGMIAFRKAHPSISRSRFWRDDVHWYGVDRSVDLSDSSHSLAFCLLGASRSDDDLYVMINAYWEPLRFTVQEGKPDEWRRVVDTSRPSPEDIAEPGQEPSIDPAELTLGPRSIVVLIRRRRQG